MAHVPRDGSRSVRRPTLQRPWDDGTDSLDNAKRRVDAAFEFISKFGAPFYCFHDRDVAPDGPTLAEANRNFEAIIPHLKSAQDRTGVKLLWGTANLFSHPRYLHGAATSCNADVFAYAAAQVKRAIAATQELGGSNYVFWGGREGYQNLYNTDMKRELDHLARFMHLAVDYAKSIGFRGQFLFEPKPKEPTKHQYDFDAAACLNFIRQYDLKEHVKLNIETNHATLAGHTMMHELVYASIQGAWAASTPTPGTCCSAGTRISSRPTFISPRSACWSSWGREALRPAASTSTPRCGARVSSRSTCSTPHIGGMDAFGRGLKIAARLRADGVLTDFVKNRYKSYDSGIGKQIEDGTASFASLEKYMLEKGNAAANESGRQEMLENIINDYL